MTATKWPSLSTVPKAIPEKQGLKLLEIGISDSMDSCPKGHSRKTRIETSYTSKSGHLHQEGPKGHSRKTRIETLSAREDNDE